MATPLHQLKAEFFKTLAHPTRVRVLEILSVGECSVADMLADLGLEASNLSQQLAVLRRSGLVAVRREGSTVYYALTSSEVAELMAVARHILTSVLAEQMGWLLTDRPVETADGGAEKSAAPARRRRAG